MNENIGIYLDDIRTPEEKPPYIDEWVIVRNYDEFKEKLYEYIETYKKIPRIVSFGHDLADEHYLHHAHNPGSRPNYYEYKEKTGMHCARLLTEVCDKNPDLQLEYVCVHSENPIGATNIQSWINNWKKLKGESPNCFIMKFKCKKDERQ